MKKRALAIILALVMCLALVPTAALAAGGDFTVENGVLIGYSGKGGAIAIPDGVSKIGDKVFEYNGDLTSVVIPEGVTCIGEAAFGSCDHLTSVTLPDSLTTLESLAFANCYSLTSVDIPAGVTQCGGAFEICTSLTHVTFANKIIGPSMFRGCTALKSVFIPGNVTTIGVGAFVDCTSLTSVTFANSVTEGGVTEIGSGAFERCTALTSVSIPFGVTSISGLFTDCTSLTSVTIPSSVTSIDAYSFYGCNSLTDIQVDSGNQNYTSVGGVLFTKDQKTLVAYPGGLQGAYTIPDSVTKVESQAFQGRTGLTSVTLSNSMTGIASRQFFRCTNLASATIPAGVTTIGSGAFADCTGLASVYIPKSVTNVKYGAFDNCTGLKDVYYGGTEAEWENVCNRVQNYNSCLTSATVHCNSAVSEQPVQPAKPFATAQPTNDKLSVDGKDATPAAYKIGGANYFMLRDVAMLLNGTDAQFEISYDNEKKAINITTGQAYTPQGYELKTIPLPNARAETSSDAVYIDGEKVELTAYKIGGANFYSIRDLGRALDFNVGWTSERGMFLETGKPYDPSN